MCVAGGLEGDTGVGKQTNKPAFCIAEHGWICKVVWVCEFQWEGRFSEGAAGIKAVLCRLLLVLLSGLLPGVPCCAGLRVAGVWNEKELCQRHQYYYWQSLCKEATMAVVPGGCSTQTPAHILKTNAAHKRWP